MTKQIDASKKQGKEQLRAEEKVEVQAELSADLGPPSALETLKVDSNYLRGSIAHFLQDALTGSIPDNDNLLLKFHGSYQQDNRDLRDERRRQKLEPDFSFMIRARLPGGVVLPEQWLIFDELARAYAGSESGLRITTRQTFQWHEVRKPNLKPLMQGIARAQATTLAACGDVNRQVVSVSNPSLSVVHQQVYAWAVRISDHFLPYTEAYAEVWLQGDGPGERRTLVAEGARADDEVEPLYGPTYLPRKFKIGLALPPTNEIDVFAQDIGLIAVVDKGQLQGFNLSVGGGMGCVHGDEQSYPRLGSVLGFVSLEQVLPACEAVLSLQRDYGNRSERRYARLKYTVDRLGEEWFKNQVEARAQMRLEPARPWHFDHNGDVFGWQQDDQGLWHLGLRTNSGRLVDTDEQAWLSGLRAIAQVHTGHFQLTCNQNVIIAGVLDAQRAQIDALVAEYGLGGYAKQSGIRLNTISCVSLPTCGLAMAEAERYAPLILPKLEALLEQYGLLEEKIVFRISGCPNGCARPYVAEIALVGRAPGRYDLRLGGSVQGERLNAVHKQNVVEEEILATLDELFARFSQERTPLEPFSDFLVRVGVLDTATLPTVHTLTVETV